MPSHIFTRLGMWQESIDSNLAATAAALAYVRGELGPDAFDGETVHTMDYMEYAYLQTGQDREAKRVVDELLTFGRAKVQNLTTAYALAAIPARYALERRDWAEGAALTEPPWLSRERFPWSEAIISYTRALGAAHTGDVAGSETQITKLQLLEESSIRPRTIIGPSRSRSTVGCGGILAHAQGKDNRPWSWCAPPPSRRHDGKYPATLAEVLPARELLADLLLSR